MSDTALKLRAKALLATACTSEHLHSSVEDIVTGRMWEHLGYESFVAMWQGEIGFKCPVQVKVLATVTMASEGMNGVGHGKTGHTIREVATAVGWYCTSAGVSASTSAVIAQYRAGVPLARISPRPNDTPGRIAKFGKVK